MCSYATVLVHNYTKYIGRWERLGAISVLDRIQLDDSRTTNWMIAYWTISAFRNIPEPLGEDPNELIVDMNNFNELVHQTKRFLFGVIAVNHFHTYTITIADGSLLACGRVFDCL
jgi:hypothetical protein